MSWWIPVAVVLLLIIIGGFFAAAEIALVSLRESQVQKLVESHGKRGRKLGHLLKDPNRFLAAIQVGLTLAGIMAAGFGAERLVPVLRDAMQSWGLPEGLVGALAFLAVTVTIAFFTLVLGELAPKRLALQRAESMALTVAGPIDWLARVSRPVVKLLSVSTNAVVKLLGGDPHARGEEISEEELRGIVATHEALTEDEREILDDVFSAGERELREVMVPRTEVEFLDSDEPVRRAVRRIVKQPYSRYPVKQGSADEVVGFVHVRDLLDPAVADRGLRVAELARPVMRLPSSKAVIPAMRAMREEGQHMAIVIDEYGGTDGVVTLEDLVEELVGDIRDEYDTAEMSAAFVGEREVAGLLNLDDFEEQTGIALPKGPYETVGGYVMAMLGRLPAMGDTVESSGRTLEVTELDGRRVSQVRVSAPIVAEVPADEA